VVVLFAAAQLADAATMRFEAEANHIVVTLGPLAYVAKALLVVAVLAVAYVLGQGRYRWVRVPMLAIGTAVGLWGAYTNLA
jgi:cytochrome c-type biogenesis protein CcmH/NrfG